ncbi:MAG: hypothetical protein ACU833_02515 [Gammaproteobacteria bacterium]
MSAQNGDKRRAIDVVRRFFDIGERRLALEGRFAETDSAYGESCRVVVDFSIPGREYLTLVGEFTPQGGVGEGIYFDEPDETILNAKLYRDGFTVEQKLTDSFSTWTKTRVKASRMDRGLRFSVYRKTSFFFFTGTVVKTCLVEPAAGNPADKSR